MEHNQEPRIQVILLKGAKNAQWEKTVSSLNDVGKPDIHRSLVNKDMYWEPQ